MRRLLHAVPLTWWLAAALLFCTTAWLVGRSLHVADVALRRWGTTHRVLVMTGEVAPGSPLRPSDAVARHVPASLAPAGAATTEAFGRIALVGLSAGEIVLTSRLAGPGRSGPAALLAPDERAMAIAVLGNERPPLVIGDRVDLLGVPADGAPPTALALDVSVVATDPEGSVTVAVTAADTLRVAAGLERGRVVVVLRAAPRAGP